MEQSPKLNRDAKRSPWLSPTGVALLVPLALAVLVLWTSPNFRAISGERNSPFGGDFLQEWIGATIVASSDRTKLYDLDHFKATQHDSSLTGFQWKETKYYPPIYSPGYYFILSPIASLDYRLATIIWLFISLAGLSITFYLLYRFHPSSRRLFPGLPIGVMLFSPLLYCLSIGHKSIFLLLIFTATYLLLFHKKPLLAGACFGLIAFKPHLLILIAVVMLWKRNWSFVGGLAMTCIGWMGLCLLAGTGLTTDYVNVLLGTGDYLNSSGYQLEMAHSLWSFFELLLGGNSSTLAKMLSVLACLGAVGWLFWRMRSPLDVRSDLFAHQFAALMIVTILVSPHFYQYDLTILLLPITLGIASALKYERDKGMIFFLVGYGLLAGLFAGIALAISIQFGTILLIVWLGLLNHRIKVGNNASESGMKPVFAV